MTHQLKKDVAPKKRRRFELQDSSLMSPNTRGFLQKICYRRGASVDMTKNGFITDSKVNPVNLLLKPLREKLEKICSQTPTKPKLKKRTSNPVKKGTVSAKKHEKHEKRPKDLNKTKGGTPVNRPARGYYVCKNLNRIDSKMVLVSEPSLSGNKGKKIMKKKVPSAARALSSKIAPFKKRASHKAPRKV